MPTNQGREFFTSTSALELLKSTDDDNRLWKQSMSRIQRGIIRLDGTAADTTLAKYRARYEF